MPHPLAQTALQTAFLSLIVLAASPLAAQSLTYSGTIDAGVTDMTDMTDRPLFGAIDATFALPLTRRAPLTFEFGTYLFALDGKKPHETYAALTWDDRFKLGALRPAYDSVLPSVFDHIAPYLAYSRAEYTRSFNTVEAMRRTAVPWGLSAQGSHGTGAHGTLEWIVSAHHATKGGFSSASAAVTYAGQGYRLMAAIEAIDDATGNRDGINAKLGARLDLAGSDIGIAVLHPEANNRPDALAADAAIRLGDRTILTVMGEFTRRHTEDAYGLGLTRDFGSFGSTTLAGTDGAAGPGLHLTHSYRF